LAHYDVELVRAAASGRWVEILSVLGGVPMDLLDGHHHGCPKACYPDAGGKDRFRLIDAAAGACFCNRCFASNNGDGFAALRWLTDQDFGSVLEMVAKHVGVKAEKAKKADPAKHLDFLNWNATTIGMWCEKKQPVTPEAVQRIGGRLARYRNEYTVVAIPVWGPSFEADGPIGYALYRADGGMLPAYTQKGKAPEWKKILLTAGSEKGIIGDPKECSALNAKQDTSEMTGRSAADSDVIGADTGSETWWKLEGPSDLLTAFSVQWPEGHKFFTTANGSKEIPLDWIVELLAGKNVNVCHDCDVPGQEGATWVPMRDGKRRPGWSMRIAERAAQVRNVVLPFPIEPKDGPDFRDFFKGGGTVQGLLELVELSRPVDKPAEGDTVFIEEAEDDPFRLARVNLKNYREQGRDLVQWRGEWYQYKGKSYTRLSREDFEPRMLEAIKAEFDRCWLERRTKEQRPVSRVTGRLLADVLKATGSLCYLKAHQEMNQWLSSGPEECVAVNNGILCLKELFKPVGDRDDSKVLLPHSSEWFSTVCLPYDFTPDAICPNWLKFLNDAFNGDTESIDTLQKWFGYLLMPDTIHHKMLFIIGQARSGKGTIMRTMVEMLGRSTVASPSLNELAGQYVLHGLMDKTVAVIPDARLSARADSVAITERLLSITGNDPQDIQRKYLGTIHGVTLKVRFTLFSNVLPKLSDTSAAFISRGIFLNMPNSYIGREDLGLGERLMKELPGILNWAILGRFMLLRDGRFKQPQSGQELVDAMQMTISPMATFLQESCDEGGQVGTKELFDAWCAWSSENDHVQKLDISTFVRRLRDVKPSIQTRRISMGANRQRLLAGVSLKPTAVTAGGF